MIFYYFNDFFLYKSFYYADLVLFSVIDAQLVIMVLIISAEKMWAYF